MASRRVTLGVYPLYPGAASASLPTPSAQVSQIKMKLIADGNYNLIESSLLGPTDATTIYWNTGGLVTVGNPLVTLISATLGYDATATINFLNQCGGIVATGYPAAGVDFATWFAGLPTTAPTLSNQFWNDGGILTRS